MSFYRHSLGPPPLLQKILPYDWNWSTGMLLGGLLSATDPVAVVALLRDLGASKKLSTLIDGEALMNDGWVGGWVGGWVQNLRCRRDGDREDEW